MGCLIALILAIVILYFVAVVITETVAYFIIVQYVLPVLLVLLVGYIIFLIVKKYREKKNPKRDPPSLINPQKIEISCPCGERFPGYLSSPYATIFQCPRCGKKLRVNPSQKKK